MRNSSFLLAVLPDISIREAVPLAQFALPLLPGYYCRQTSALENGVQSWQCSQCSAVQYSAVQWSLGSAVSAVQYSQGETDIYN